MRAMILAAGRGKRLRPLTDQVPKALITVDGDPLIVHAIRRLKTAGIVDVVINAGWLGDKLQYALGNGERLGVRINYSEERDELMETGGGIRRALSQLGPSPFWLLNADVLCDYPFPPVKLGRQDLGHLVLVTNPEHHPEGDFVLKNRRVRLSGGQKLTYAGIALLHPDLFTGLPEEPFPLAPLFREAAERDSLGGEHYQGAWLDVGTSARLEAARGIWSVHG